MSHKWECPGNALQRSTGAKIGSQLESTTLHSTYSFSHEIQRRYLQRHCGLDDRLASLVAGFCFGEVR